MAIGRKQEKIFILCGLVPLFVWFAFFFALPFFQMIFRSFYDWNLLLNIDDFIGFDNYKRMLKDAIFWVSFFNSLKALLFIVPPTVVISLFVAVLINRFSVFIKNIFLPIYFMPTVTSMVAIGMIWSWLFNYKFGLLNYLLSLIGLGPFDYLGDRATSLLSICAVVVWQRVGYYAVIFYAALMNVPSDLYEAAHMDGAGSIRKFFSITLPLCLPTVFFVTVVTSMEAFRLFIPVKIMTGGGPGTSSHTLLYYIYLKGIEQMDMGYAMSVTVVMFLMIILITIFQKRAFAGWGGAK